MSVPSWPGHPLRLLQRASCWMACGRALRAPPSWAGQRCARTVSFQPWLSSAYVKTVWEGCEQVQRGRHSASLEFAISRRYYVPADSILFHILRPQTMRENYMFICIASQTRQQCMPRRRVTIHSYCVRGEPRIIKRSAMNSLNTTVRMR